MLDHHYLHCENVTVGSRECLPAVAAAQEQNKNKTVSWNYYLGQKLRGSAQIGSTANVIIAFFLARFGATLNLFKPNFKVRGPYARNLRYMLVWLRQFWPPNASQTSYESNANPFLMNTPISWDTTQDIVSGCALLIALYSIAILYAKDNGIGHLFASSLPALSLHQCSEQKIL